MEINVIISAPGLEAALVNLAGALSGRHLVAEDVAKTVITSAPDLNTPIQIPHPIQAMQPVPMPTYPAPEPAPVYVAPAAPAPAPVVPVTAAPTYTQTDMAKACVQLMDLKGQPAIVSIMAGFGVQALTQIPKERFNELAAVLRAEGVNI